MKYRCLTLACVFMTSAAHSAVVMNPVSAPIAADTKVSLELFGQAQASGSPAVDGYRTRLQTLQPVRDKSGRLFVNDTRGTISVVGPSGGTPQTWFDIRDKVASFSNASSPSQTGLMSFALHPNFAGNPTQPGYGVFYTVDTSAPSGKATLAGKGTSVDHDNVVHEFRVSDPTSPVADIVAQREVLRVSQPFSDHGAGTIAFNPGAAPGTADYGKLYIGFGDGGGMGDSFGNAQDLGSPLGKILRIDPAAAGSAPYTIPTDNPHVGQVGALGEVWANGLRNPQNFSWDGATGQMLIADIGQSQLEEVNIGTKGANYGWPTREGTFARGANWWDPDVYDAPANSGSFVDPVAQFDHEEIFRDGTYWLAAISGVVAYTGTALPELTGMVVLSELVSGRLFYYDPLSFSGTTPVVLSELGLVQNGMDVTLNQLDGNPFPGGRVDLRLGADGNGELYLLSKTFGDIYRLGSLAAVPEPASWMMMITGFGLIGGALRRRRNGTSIDCGLIRSPR